MPQPLPAPGPGAPGAPASPPSSPYRLPRTIEPLAYRLRLEPDLEAGEFSGSVDIDVRVLEQTDEVVMNAADLKIVDASVLPPAGDPVAVGASCDEALERLVLRLPAPLAKGDATVSISFTGKLDEALRGFYRCTFTDEAGAVRTMAATQMEATDARRTFPCWDEPDRKATFEVTAVVDEGLAVFSNAPVASEQVIQAPDGTAKREVRFAPTMKMSTYLVALVVGELETTEPVDVHGVPVRVAHTPGKAHLTAFALDAARHALEFFTAYFGIEYPGQKLDLVGIPDFAFGAMENLGCVTFREADLLVDAGKASQVELIRVADVVHHEIAHMWFGDLVTMGWWEGIWLNEAFATFMQILASDDYRPEWQSWVSFGLERAAAMAVDSLHTTRPIEYPVGSPAEADGMFDVLTYEKGGSVLRMLEQYLGADVFRDGVRRYLEAHAYGNTVTADLWNALEDASGVPVRAVADSWILQGGHPLVVPDGATLRQEPFSYLAAPPQAASAIGQGWLVPVMARSSGTDAQVERLLLADEVVALPAALAGGPGTGAEESTGPALLNAGGTGVYRVGYPPAQLRALAEHRHRLEPLERLQVLSDGWALVLADRLDLGVFFAVASAFAVDDDEPAVYQVVRSALRLCRRIAGEEELPLVQAAARTLLGPRAAILGWDAQDGEGARVPTLRAWLLDELGTTGATPEVRAEAARRFDADAGGGAPLAPDLVAAVLDVVADQGHRGDYERVLERYRHARHPQDERRHLLALGAFPDVDLCLSSFELALGEARRQDGPLLVRALLANRVGGVAVWEQLKSHWQSVLDHFPDVIHARMLQTVDTMCRDPEVVADVQRFLTEHPLPVGRRSVAQTLEQLEVHARFGRRWRGALAEALQQASGASAGQ